MIAAGVPPWLARALRHPVASAAALTLGIRVGQELSRLRRGDIDREEFERRMGQHLGALGGTLSGASLGWTLGRAFPGVGAIVGAFGGGLLGHLGGERAGRAGAARVSRIFVRDAAQSDETASSPTSTDPIGPTEAEVCDGPDGPSDPDEGE